MEKSRSLSSLFVCVEVDRKAEVVFVFCLVLPLILPTNRNSPQLQSSPGRVT